ncbi:MAG TPA: NAD(P)(+) transhydrogenase (Re/Si-specific) subunit alpha [Nocardioidaceae bacterium]|nr:NAD(P)(+) transhydrogenase (Re/Si-specific) subunit alpha [Nocardioidaceae bacterium]
MRVAVARERREGETRVALVPALVGRLRALGYDVVVEAGAGLAAGHPDEEYVEEGAVIGGLDADLVLAVHAVEGAAPSITLTGGSFALERVPRISRAQSMDVLTSQALVAGYRAVVVAADLLGRMFPLTMTAAGTIPAARVLVLGTGVAGLEAIATAHRLGAVVSAYDVRASSAEEIRSLGAEAVDLGLPPLDAAAGYAREMTSERAALQQSLLAPHVAAADVLITTAAVPGRVPPVLVSRSMVEAMSPGSVVVDLFADAGGNVEGSVAGAVTAGGRAQVWGGANVPAQLPGPASRLFAHNVVSFVELVTRNGRFDPDYDDEIVRACWNGSSPRS